MSTSDSIPRKPVKQNTKENSEKKTIIDTFIAPLCEDNIELLYSDTDILIINKPSGLLSLSGKNPLNKDSVHYRLVQQFPSATMVHRLDFGTSGLMVLALNKASNSALTKQFQARTIQKRYTAILEGKVKPDMGEITLAIAKDSSLFPRMVLCETKGKPAQTQYKVLSHLNAPERTRIEFTPLTGRTHQLRIHSLAFGHPILGCDLYNSATSQQQATRLLLHASELTFEHPSSGESVSFKSECPF